MVVLNGLRISPALNKFAHPLSTLRQRNFGMVWTSIMFAGMGSQMETLVVAWLVLTLTDSPLMVGLISLGGRQPTSSAYLPQDFTGIWAAFIRR